MSLSRRRLAMYLADSPAAERPQRLQQVAAWLTLHHRTHEANYLVRDLLSIMSSRGEVAATAITAHPISSSLKSRLENLVQSHYRNARVDLVTEIDPSLLGGVKIDTPDAQLDASVAAKLHTFVTEMSR